MDTHDLLEKLIDIGGFLLYIAIVTWLIWPVRDKVIAGYSEMIIKLFGG